MLVKFSSIMFSDGACEHKHWHKHPAFPFHIEVVKSNCGVSCAGFPKGKRQLAARLQVLMWAVRVSGAVPSGVPITGRGHLYLPGYARFRPHDIQLDGGSMSISIASI